MTGFDNSSRVEEASRSTVNTNMLHSLKQQDSQAWERMTALYLPLVYRRCLRLGLSAEDAADVTQEVFHTVARRIQEFQLQGDGSFRRWLWAILRNKLGDFFRAAAAQPRAVGGSTAHGKIANVSLPQGDDFSEEEASELYHRGLAIIQNQFNELTWKAFWMTVVEQQKPADVAAALGASVNTVYLSKSRVLRRLREELGDEHLENG